MCDHDARFARTRLLVGEKGMGRLRGAWVAVYGLGGVGSYALEALARAGVGRLFIVDFDLVEASNVNRQLLALGSTIGRAKVEVARERALEINPCAQVEAVGAFVRAENMATLVPAGLHCAIDAIDSLGPKVHLLAALHHAGTCLVSCMGAASRLSPTDVRVGDLADAHHCPLTRRVRQRLRRLGIERGIRCVYSHEPAQGVFDPDDASRRGPGRTRKVRGSISYVPGIVGLTAAGLIINDILSDGSDDER